MRRVYMRVLRVAHGFRTYPSFVRNRRGSSAKPKWPSYESLIRNPNKSEFVQKSHELHTSSESYMYESHTKFKPALFWNETHPAVIAFRLSTLAHRISSCRTCTFCNSHPSTPNYQITGASRAVCRTPLVTLRIGRICSGVLCERFFTFSLTMGRVPVAFISLPKFAALPALSVPVVCISSSSSLAESLILET